MRSRSRVRASFSSISIRETLPSSFRGSSAIEASGEKKESSSKHRFGRSAISRRDIFEIFIRAP